MSAPKISTACNNKAHTVYVNNATYYFSFETCIAVETKGTNVRLANTWGPTTGKHFNQLGCKDFTIVDKDEFQQIVNSIG